MPTRHQEAVADLRFHHEQLGHIGQIGRISTRFQADSIYPLDQPIYANDNFDIGRYDFEDTWDIELPTISAHHVRVRCVAYEEDGPVRVAPMVYARVLSRNSVHFIQRHADGTRSSRLVSNTDTDILLDHGDVLQLTASVSLEFLAAQHCAPKSDGLDEAQRLELAVFRDRYRITSRRLGVGGNASVFVAIKTKTQRQIACKVIKVPFIDLAQYEAIWDEHDYAPNKRTEKVRSLERNVIKRREEIPREYNILKSLSHPNIVALEKVFCTPNNYYIFQELVTGGDLMSYLDKNGALGESQAAVIVRQILKAVEYLHENGVVHRDIKPENVLMASWREGARVVLTDFGQARTISDAKAVARDTVAFRMQSMVGTLGYVAP
jgi:tRNA A-37 threonylcarbamoyl transferase component Bud32